MHAKARKLLDSIGSKVSTHRMVSELSVSDKQMVEIAKALSYDSKLIIMDEPSSSLTSDEMEKLVKIIHDLKSKGIAIIYISHKLDEILGFCDVVTVMRDGHVIDTRPVSEMSRNQMISMMVGRTIENEFPPRPESAGETILEIKHINTRKLKDVQLSLRKGEILGLVGLVGSGRTELVRALFGADKVAKKSIYLDGKPVEINNPIDAINLGLAMVPEDRKLQGLLLGFPVEQNISLAVLIRLTKYGFIDCEGGEHGQRPADQGAQHQDAIRQDEDQDTVRREPAEGDPRSVAGDEAPDPRPRRADQGHRRRGEVRDLPADEEDRRGWRVDHPDLIRASRGPQHEQPGQYDQRWPGQR